jgi:hypothetical protein
MGRAEHGPATLIPRQTPGPQRAVSACRAQRTTTPRQRRSRKRRSRMRRPRSSPNPPPPLLAEPQLTIEVAEVCDEPAGVLLPRTRGSLRNPTDQAGHFCLCRIAPHTRSASTRAETCIRVATQLHCGSPRDVVCAASRAFVALTRSCRSSCVGRRRQAPSGALPLPRSDALLMARAGLACAWDEQQH